MSDIENKITDHDHEKYITSPEFNTMAASVFNTRLAQANLIKKADLDTDSKKFSDRVTSNKSKHLLAENELKKLEKFDAAYFRSKNYFHGNDGTQNYLVFQLVYKYFELNNGNVSSRESKGFSNEKTTSVSLDILSQTNNLPKLVHNNDDLQSVTKYYGNFK